MPEEMSQEEIIEQQKANCIFCKIIKGEVPSKKVYEDDKIIAVMDINPACKGHILVMPKEHYAIMPMIPPDVTAHMFIKVKQLSKCVRDSVLATGSTVFIANGGIAGQQAPHFLLHVIPREKGDKLDNFVIPKKEFNPADVEKVLKPLTQNIYVMNKDRFEEFGSIIPDFLKGPQGGQPGAPQGQPGVQQAQPQVEVSAEDIQKILSENPEIMQLIRDNPDGFRQAMESNPQLKMIFGKIDIDKLSESLKGGAQ